MRLYALLLSTAAAVGFLWPWPYITVLVNR
jgi:hypothetical protein